MQQTSKTTRYKRTRNIEKNYFVAYQTASELQEPAKQTYGSQEFSEECQNGKTFYFFFTLAKKQMVILSVQLHTSFTVHVGWQPHPC